MELEKAIKVLTEDSNVYQLNKLLNDTLNTECPEYYQAIDTVIANLQEQYQKGYLKGKEDEEKIMLVTIKNHYIDKAELRKLLNKDNLYENIKNLLNE